MWRQLFFGLLLSVCSYGLEITFAPTAKLWQSEGYSLSEVSLASSFPWQSQIIAIGHEGVTSYNILTGNRTWIATALNDTTCTSVDLYTDGLQGYAVCSMYVVYAFNCATGNVLWRVGPLGMEEADYGVLGLSFLSGLVLVTTTNHVHALTTTGAWAWNFTIPNGDTTDITALSEQASSKVIVQGANAFYVVNGSNGALTWTPNLPAASIGDAIAVLHSGACVISLPTDTSCSIVSLALVNKSVTTLATIDDNCNGLTTGPSGHSTAIIVAASNQFLAIDAFNGSTLWTVASSVAYQGMDFAAQLHDYFIFGKANIHCVAMADGQLRWKSNDTGVTSLFGSGLIANVFTDDALLIVLDTSVFLLDSTSGVIRWSVTSQNVGDLSGPLAFSVDAVHNAGVVAIPSQQGSVEGYLIDRRGATFASSTSFSAGAAGKASGNLYLTDSSSGGTVMLNRLGAVAWFSAGITSLTIPVELADGQGGYVVAVSQETPYDFTVLNAETGAVNYRQNISMSQCASSVFTAGRVDFSSAVVNAAQNTLYFLADTSCVYVYTVGSPVTAVTFPTTSFIVGVTLVEGASTIVAVDETGATFAVSLDGSRLGDVRWSSAAPGPGLIPADLTTNGALAFLTTVNWTSSTNPTVLKAIDPLSGSVKFTAMNPGLAKLDFSGVVYDNTVFFVDDSGNVSCVAIPSGEVLWQAQVPTLDGHFYSLTRPQVTPDGLLVIAASKQLVAFETATGRRLWVHNLDPSDTCNTSLCLSSFTVLHGVVYYSFLGVGIGALDLYSGERWLSFVATQATALWAYRFYTNGGAPVDTIAWSTVAYTGPTATVLYQLPYVKYASDPPAAPTAVPFGTVGDSHRSSARLIAGVVAGILAVAAIAALAYWFVYARHKSYAPVVAADEPSALRAQGSYGTYEELK